MKQKICFVIQRYGAQSLGGSESYCRQIAEKLAPYYEIDVVTSQCTDSSTWENDIEETLETVGGVTVRRFPATQGRVLTEAHYHAAFADDATLEDSRAWIEAQGPLCPSLVSYVKEHRDDYAAFVLVTYLYHPVVASSYEVGDKAVLIPTAHDESYIHQPIFLDVFGNVAGLHFLTPEEKAFVERDFPVEGKIMNSGIHGGVGVDLPDVVDPAAFREKYNLGDDPYLVYAGRIEHDKGFPRFFQYFQNYKKATQYENLKLVLMGKALVDVPERADILSLGFVSEKDKFDGMAGALALVQPSGNESLSIVVLEALSLGTPVLVNGSCDVLKGHCLRSDAGLYFDNGVSFGREVDFILGCPEEYAQMRINAKKYIENNYQWQAIVDDLRHTIDQVIEQA